MNEEQDKILINRLANDLAVYILMGDRLFYLKEWRRLNKVYGREIFVQVQKKALEIAREGE